MTRSGRHILCNQPSRTEGVSRVHLRLRPILRGNYRRVWRMRNYLPYPRRNENRRKRPGKPSKPGQQPLLHNVPRPCLGLRGKMPTVFVHHCHQDPAKRLRRLRGQRLLLRRLRGHRLLCRYEDSGMKKNVCLHPCLGHHPRIQLQTQDLRLFQRLQDHPCARLK